ncbi:TPA: putative C-S lyase [Serratia marcescens]|uniref:MalY/PatB family protein n=1 Tax=Serratia nevei TaxID=2703794 RepID=UPI001A21AD1E|nr:PatB family C-S lyase [Serratia nevei]MCP1108482.1 PatB family C-S lyase [Serratia nevei]HAT4986065.1 putative C-S lyase [Serratia marcescens]HAT5032577.1 putative C-S lyase [Serratia marcescens]HAT5032785.1 putative C-S lyase [Serratia marcescens]
MQDWIIQFFDVHVSRLGTHSSKWDRPNQDNVLPFSVADMDFYSPPAVINSLSNNIRHGVFGYHYVPEDYFNSIIEWFSRRHNYNILREWLVCASGVDVSISTIIKSISSQGDEIIIQEPVYNMFASCIESSGRTAMINNLIYRDNKYYIDFEELEIMAARESCKAMLFCSPHNPIGRVWSEDEISQLGSICARHGVIVISDESHCDIIFGDNKHIPFSKPTGNILCSSVVCFSPSKSFNISGVKQGVMIISNTHLREKIKDSLKNDFANDISIFAISSLIAAYNDSEWWLESVKDYIYRNYKLFRKYIFRYLPKCKVVDLQGTYLVWVDISKTGFNSNQILELLSNKVGVIVNSGSIYGKSGESFIRVNLACKYSMLKEAIRRLKYMDF